MLDRLDTLTLRFFSRFSDKSAVANRVVLDLFMLPTIRLLPLVGALWLVWFSKTRRDLSRLAVICALISMFVAGLLSRLVQDFSPERIRPLHSGNPDFVPSVGVNPGVLEHWSSFPSDHAAITFALSTAVFRVSYPLGLACYAWSFFVVCIPRLYAGYHYASDVLAGAMLGVVSAWAVSHVISRVPRAFPFIESIRISHKPIFYLLAFVLLFQFATMFEDLRHIGQVVVHGASLAQVGATSQ